MKRTAVCLGGVEIGSSVMNTPGLRSAERGEIYELSAVHTGAVALKSCTLVGLDRPEGLRNRGVEHFAAIAGELRARGKVVIASAWGASADEMAAVAERLDRAGVSIVELNLADYHAIRPVSPLGSVERIGELVAHVRERIAAPLAVRLPSHGIEFEPEVMAGALKAAGAAILVCTSDLPAGLEVDFVTGIVKGPARPLSQVYAYFRAGAGTLDIIAAGAIESGHEAYLAHLAGAKAVQAGSIVTREGAGALGRIDRELDAMLSDNGHGSVAEIIGALRFAE